MRVPSPARDSRRAKWSSTVLGFRASVYTLHGVVRSGKPPFLTARRPSSRSSPRIGMREGSLSRASWSDGRVGFIDRTSARCSYAYVYVRWTASRHRFSARNSNRPRVPRPFSVGPFRKVGGCSHSAAFLVEHWTFVNSDAIPDVPFGVRIEVGRTSARRSWSRKREAFYHRPTTECEEVSSFLGTKRS